jgi:hypothetical protein
MRQIAHSSAVINCSSDKAYSLISNMEKFGEWFPEIVSVTSKNDLTHGEVGKKYLVTITIPLLGKRTVDVTVLEAITNRRFFAEGVFLPWMPSMKMKISAMGNDEISFTWGMYSRSTSWIVNLMLIPIAKRAMQKRADIAVVQLKALLEASSEQP